MKITRAKLNSLLKEGLNEYYMKKNRNSRIAKLVKEEYNKIVEGSTDDEWEMVDAVVVALGHEGALDALVQALPSDAVMDAMKYIARMHEIPMEMDEGSRDDEWEMVDAVVAALGHEGALDALVQALPSDSVRDSMEYIARMHEIPMEMDEETKPHEADRRPADTPKDRIRLEEGNEASKLIDALGKVGDAIEGALGNLSDDPADAEAVMKGMPEVMKVLNAANEQVQQVWEAMHDMLGVNEETKPHEADRKPADTPEDRIRK